LDFAYVVGDQARRAVMSRMAKVRIGLVGDRTDTVRAHGAIPQALAFASEAAGCAVEHAWLPTPDLAGDVGRPLARFDAIWCVPGSPYASMDGALAAIRYAREHRVPFLGTCGGFQHAVIEVARDVLGLREAEHAESSPDAALPIVTRLACSLVRVKRTIALVPGSRLAALYGRAEATEEYQCNFGVNAAYRAALEQAGLRFTAIDEDGDVRALELPEHPFFLGTLFQLELSALAGATHPIAVAFVRAAAAEALTRR
jgi:CTP synthase (UTP-ammonia lyase)